MIITEEEIDLPDYFRRGDVEPVLYVDPISPNALPHSELRIYKSSETSESGASSYVILNDEDLTSVLVGFYFTGLSRKARAKTRGGQFWRHYKDGARVDWKKLPDEDRLRILEACDVSAIRPWAKAPGKLSSQYHKPNHHKKVERDAAGAIIGYKYLTWIEIEKVFRSNWSPVRFIEGAAAPVDIYWRDNSLEADEIPTEENTNGIYAAKTFDSPILGKYSGRQWKDGKPDKYHTIKLVRLLLSGVVLEGDFGYRAERADILEVFENENREDQKEVQDREAGQGQ